MTVSTVRPGQRLTARWLVAGTIALALSGAAKAAGQVDVDLGALDALPPATAKAPGKVQLRPPARAKTAPAEHPAPAAKPAGKSTLHLVPPPDPAPDTAPAETATSAPAKGNTTPEGDAMAAPSIVVPPPPVVAAPPAPAAPPLAALTPPSAPTPAATAEPTGRLVFTGSSFDLSQNAKTELDGLAKRLAANAHLYLQLVAYADGSDGSESRRLSLSRALAARSYLLDHGVDGKQVDVRPLGNRAEPGLPPDRVDCVVVTR